MTDEHIRIIVQTSQKDGIDNQHVNKVDNWLSIRIQINRQCKKNKTKESIIELIKSSFCKSLKIIVIFCLTKELEDEDC